MAAWSESVRLGTCPTKLFLVPGRLGSGTYGDAKNFAAAGLMQREGIVNMLAAKGTSDMGSGLKHPAGSILLGWKSSTIFPLGSTPVVCGMKIETPYSEKSPPLAPAVGTLIAFVTLVRSRNPS